MVDFFLIWSAWKYLLARQCAFKIIVNFSEGFQFWNSSRFWYGNPADTRHWPKAGSMLVLRLRRRPNIEPTLGQCLVFAGKMLVFIESLWSDVGMPHHPSPANDFPSARPSRRVQAWQFSPILTGDNWGKLFTIKGVREIDPSRSLTRTQRVGVGDKFLWKSPVVSGGEGSGVGLEAVHARQESGKNGDGTDRRMLDSIALPLPPQKTRHVETMMF